jgi:hypothetical protein
MNGQSSRGRSIRPVPAVALYFRQRGTNLTGNPPVICQEFSPAAGWRPYGMLKRPSAAWLRKRRADFSITELLFSKVTDEQAWAPLAGVPAGAEETR